MENTKRTLINNILILCIGIISLNCIRNHDSLFAMLYGTPIYLGTIVLALICLIRLIIVPIRFKKRTPKYFINFFYAIFIILYLVIDFVIYFIFITAGIIVSQNLGPIGSITDLDLNIFFSALIPIAILVVINIYSYKNFKSDIDFYFIIPLVFIMLVSVSELELFIFLNPIMGYMNIPINILIFSLLGVFAGVVTIYHLIVLCNLAFERKFYKPKTGFKVFTNNLFRKKLAYYLGVAFTLITGIFYIIPGINNRFYFYIGLMFVFMSMLRIFNQIWIYLVREKDKKFRFINYYLLIIVNAIFLAILFFLLRITLLKTLDKSASNLGVFTAIQIIILIIRLVIAIFGYYNSRIVRKTEPHVIATNNLDIISFIVAAVAFIFPFLAAVGVGKYDINNVFNIINIISLSLIGIIIILMPIRAIYGLIILKKEYKNK